MSSGAKKEKSFNGTKAKFSPNAAVQEKEKKAEVKLRRKESEKVKQSGDSNRKSVLGRFFHNLVDSDDSRKKAASADAKKKKGRDAGGSDLDLPEHGIVLRNTQTLQRDQPQLPSPRTRAMTLTNQSRDSRNRWSSYDIQACNFMEGGVLPPTVPETDCSTLGHRSLSEETLNASLSADQRPLSKITDSFINHSDSVRQPDAMRKHAQLLQSIQETKANRLSRSDKTVDAQVGQSSNGYRLTTEMVIDGQKTDAGIMGHNTDQKLNDLQKASSCDSADGNRELLAQNQTTASSSDALVLLNEKSQQIDKAIADKRRILSQLFSVTEEDLNRLLENNVDLSADPSIRKMILISLLQSDRLTSVISSLLVPLNDGCTDGAADKEAAADKGGKCFEDKASSQAQLLHEVAFRLHSHLTLLQQIVDQDAAETDRLKKDLEEAQQQIRMKNMPAEAKLDLSEASVSSDEVIQQNADLSISTEVQGINNESSNNTVDNVTASDSTQKTRPTESNDLNVPDEKEKVEETFPLVDELVNNTEHTNATRLSSADTDVKIDVKLPSDVSQNSSPCISKSIDTVISEIHVENKVIVLNDNDTLGHQEESVPSCEIGEELSAVLVSSDRNTNDIIVPAEVKEDNETDLQDMNDDFNKLVGEGDEVGDLYHPDNNRKFMSLESIPEDDDRLSCCDVELKDSAHKTLNLEPIVNDGIEVAVQDDVLITVEDSTTLDTEGEAQSNLKDDDQSNVEDDMHSSFNEDLVQSADEAQSDAAGDMHFNVTDAQPHLGDELLSTTLHDSVVVDASYASNVQADAPFITDTPSHTRDDAEHIAVDDARSDKQDDTPSDTEDDFLSNLYEFQTNVTDEEGSCRVDDPATIADVDLKSDSDLQNCQELESTLTEEKSSQFYDLTRPENLESEEEEEENLETENKQEDLKTDTGVETKNLETEIKPEDLEKDTDMETSKQLENKNSTESETDGELESENDRRLESDVLNLLELTFLESEPKENFIWGAERLPIESEDVHERILDELDISSDELTEPEEISHLDIHLEERKTATVNEPKTVIEGLLHNHVKNSSESSLQENSKCEIAEVVSDSLDLNECDKITRVSSGRE